MKILTGNRLTDGVAVWYAADGHWAERIERARTVADKADEAELEAIGRAAAAANIVVDLDLVDVELKDGRIVPLRLRERIRAAGPTNRTDLGKQAEAAA
jgi:hypothetical protein